MSYDSELDQMHAAAEREFRVYQQDLDKLGKVIDRKDARIRELEAELQRLQARIEKLDDEVYRHRWRNRGEHGMP